MMIALYMKIGGHKLSPERQAQFRHNNVDHITTVRIRGRLQTASSMLKLPESGAKIGPRRHEEKFLGMIHGRTMSNGS